LDSKVSDTTSEPVPQQATEKAEDQTAGDTPAEELQRISFDAQPADTTTAQYTSVPIPEINAPITLSPRTSLDSKSSRPSLDLPTTQSAESEATLPQTAAELETELSALRKTHDQTILEHREELHSHLERIDALQSKLTYLSQSLASQAKAASKSADTNDPLEKKLAEKDAQVAALMEEGQKLSKTELKHLNAIKKMRMKVTDTEKEIANLKQRLSRAEKSIGDSTERARRAEAAERNAQEKLKIVGRIEKDVDALRAEREEAGLTIGELRRQLSDALSRAEEAEKRAKSGALEAEKRATADLRDDLENARIEKKLADDRSRKEIQEVKEDAARQQERAKIVELELQGEITVSFLLEAQFRTMH
jgi:chromosome segregation ATPase